jgi:hypothetical protein
MDSSHGANRFTGTIVIGRVGPEPATPGKAQQPHAGLPFTPEIESMCVLPSQFHTRRNKGQFVGERRLFAAVLQDAIYRYLRCRGVKTYHSRVAFFEAKRWFEDKRRSKLFGFENVCEILGIDSNRLRSSLERLSRQSSELRSSPTRLPSLKL